MKHSGSCGMRARRLLAATLKGADMGRKETEEAIADNRADRVKRVASVTDLSIELKADDVLAEAEAADEYPPAPVEREWVDAPAVGRGLAERESRVLVK